MSYQELNLRKEGGIAYVTLNRPEKMNAISYELVREIISVQKQLKRDKSLRAVIINGAEGNFSSGFDTKSMVNNPLNLAKIGVKFFPTKTNVAQLLSIGWQRLPIPVIAVIEGVCFGAAMDIVLGADMRYASANAQLSIMEIKWGLMPDMGGFDSLRTLITKDTALELLYTGDIIKAEKAQEINLVTRVSEDPMQEAQAMAEKIINGSPDAIAAIKLSVHKSWSASTPILLARETIYQVALIISRNRRIAVLRNKKAPSEPFKKRQWWW